jgi:hypothetical protein
MYNTTEVCDTRYICIQHHSHQVNAHITLSLHKLLVHILLITGRQFETEQWNGETNCQRILVQAMPRSAIKDIEMNALQWQYIALAQQFLKAIVLVFISLRAFK